MNKKIISNILSLITIMIIAIMIIPNITNAYSVSTTSINLTVGGTATITINASGETGRFDITSSNSNVVAINQSFVWAENNSIPITVTAKSEGSATITITPTDVSNSANGNTVSGARQVAVTVTAQTQQPPVNNNPSPKPSPKPSPVALTFSNANETVYATTDVTVRSNHTTSSSSLGQLKQGESVTRTGVSNTTADGFYWSRITYKGQTAYVASKFLTTTKPTTPSPEVQKSNDSTLKNLSITGVQISPEFNANVTEYVANISDDINEIEVIAEVNNEKASYEVVGNTELQNGENTVIVTVTAEDGSFTNYQIKVIKGEQDLQLSTLIIKGINSAGEEVIVELNPEFNGKTLEYTIDLKEFLKSISIEAIANNVDAIVEGAGEFELVVGENKYTITVKLQKENEEEEIIEYSITIKNPEQVVANEDASETMKNMLKIACAVVIALCAIGIIAAIIHFRRQNREDSVGEYTQPIDYSYLSKDIKDDNNNEKDIEEINNDYNSYNSENSNNDDNNDNKGRKRGKHF